MEGIAKGCDSWTFFSHLRTGYIVFHIKKKFCMCINPTGFGIPFSVSGIGNGRNHGFNLFMLRFLFHHFESRTNPMTYWQRIYHWQSSSLSSSTLFKYWEKLWQFHLPTLRNLFGICNIVVLQYCGRLHPVYAGWWWGAV